MSSSNGSSDKGQFLGSLWVEDDGRGGVRISGIINGERVKLVVNAKRKDEASPFYYVFSIPKKGGLEGGQF